MLFVYPSRLIITFYQKPLLLVKRWPHILLIIIY